MPPTSSAARREALRRLNFSRELAEKGWYHSMDFRDGTAAEGVISLENLKRRYALFPLPGDLMGKRVLDIGAWDGWFSFECERRGATVTAIDCVEIDNFLYAQQKLGSQVDYRVLDLFELPQAGLEPFDYVLFLGVLYHLKHPLLALEIVCRFTREVTVVDSFVADADTWRERVDEVPWMEFYETCELGEQLDNWVGPSVGCLMALCRAAGFARVELLGIEDQHACVACYRRWEPVAATGQRPAPVLLAACHSLNYGINFSANRDEYLTCWFQTSEPELRREMVLPQVGDYGTPALYLTGVEPKTWIVNFRLPPGLARGWQMVGLRTTRSGLSNTLPIALDVPAEADHLVVIDVSDGISWERGTVRFEGQGFLSFWIQGLSSNCDRHNVRPYLGVRRLTVEFISQAGATGFRQINARVPAGVEKGEHSFTVRFGSAVSEPQTVRVV